MTDGTNSINPNDTISDDDQNEGELTLLQHLNELRIRLTWAAVGIAVGTVISFIFAERILTALLIPYANSVAGEVTLQALGPTDSIEAYFKISLMAGAIVSMPFSLLQLWLFISPGLTKRERRLVFLFLPSGVLLFGLGLAFAWFILIPAAILFLANFLPDIFQADWTGTEYIGFILRMLFWLGISFQLPIIIYFLARVGLVTARTLRDQWRVAVVVIAVLAALITPSIDPVTMLLTMLPLNLLYGFSILLARVGQRQFAQKMAFE